MGALGLFLWIILGVVLQAGLFLAISFWRHWQTYSRLVQGQAGGAVPVPEDVPTLQPGSAWPGYRPFKVTRRVTEEAAGQVCSFHLEPQDGQALPLFRPGQFLTFRVEVPTADGSGSEQLTRCYSLSHAPRADFHRVSIRRVPSPPGSDLPPGRVSAYFHDRVAVGATLHVRAPSGHFYLEADDSPIVLVAGGIGITPILSMLEWCLGHQPGREVWCFYGARNGSEAAFAAELRALAAGQPRLHLRLCFSNPLPGDRPGEDFHHQGRVDVRLFRLEMPLKPYHYYICGPSAMMADLVSGLADWGVPDARIHFEAFGPASIKGTQPAASVPDVATAAGELTVTFTRSGRQARWSAAAGSLLEFAEAQGIAVDSGCRAGGCGACQTTIQAGEVAYRQAPDHDPEPGTCLLCVCTPKSDLSLEA